MAHSAYLPKTYRRTSEQLFAENEEGSAAEL